MESGLPQKVAEHLKNKLFALADAHDCVGDVRGIGHFWGLEIVKNRETKEPFNVKADKLSGKPLMTGKIAGEAIANGLYMAPWYDTLVIAPPLTITTEEVDQAMDILGKALKVGDAEAVSARGTGIEKLRIRGVEFPSLPRATGAARAGGFSVYIPPPFPPSLYTTPVPHASLQPGRRGETWRYQTLSAFIACILLAVVSRILPPHPGRHQRPTQPAHSLLHPGRRHVLWCRHSGPGGLCPGAADSPAGSGRPGRIPLVDLERRGARGIFRDSHRGAGTKLGAASMVALIVAGQMIMSVFLDHYGLLGYPLHPMSWARLAGVCLLVGGVVMIRLL